MPIKRPKRDKVKPQANEATSAVNSDMYYRYSLYVDRSLMADYLDVCKRRKVSAAQQIATFLTKENAKYSR